MWGSLAVLAPQDDGGFEKISSAIKVIEDDLTPLAMLRKKWMTSAYWENGWGSTKLVRNCLFVLIFI